MMTPDGLTDPTDGEPQAPAPTPQTPVLASPPPPKHLEALLAEQAGSAIAAGADPKAVSHRLGTLVLHMRNNPSLRAQADAAIDGGADPHAVAERYAKIATTPFTDTAANAPDAPPQESTMRKVALGTLGTLASLGKDIPGVEALQAGTRSLVRGESYADALANVKALEEHAPALLRKSANVGGGALATLALPGGPVLKGARYGILSALGSSDPNADLKDRIDNAAVEGAAGAVTGKAAELAPNLVRGAVARPLGASALSREASTAATDAANYGKAAGEGAFNGGTSPIVRRALSDPKITPFVNAVRSTDQFAHADDATVLSEAYKLMSERQGMLEGRLSNSDFKAGTSLENRDIGMQKDKLLRATASPSSETLPPVVTKSPGAAAAEAMGDPHVVDLDPTVVSPGGTVRRPPLMPSFPTAVEQHSAAMGERDAFRQGADVARRMIGGQSVAAKNLAKKSPEAFRAAIQTMTPGEAQAATEGLLGRLKESMGLTPNPLKLFGAGPAIANTSKVSGLLNDLDAKTGSQSLLDVLRSAMIAGTIGQ